MFQQMVLGLQFVVCSHETQSTAHQACIGNHIHDIVRRAAIGVSSPAHLSDMMIFDISGPSLCLPLRS
jgi:hypothetical protein